MTFSIIVPAYNEHETLLKNIPILCRKFPQAEILIVENGSAVSPDFTQYENVQLIHAANKGLGIGLKWGLVRAKHSIVVFLPADLSYALDFVNTAVLLVKRGWVLVIGSKAVSYPSLIRRPFYRKMLSEIYTSFWDMFYGLKIKDFTGVKAYNRDWAISALPFCPSDGIRFEVQLIRQLRRWRLKIVEIPVEVNDFRPGYMLNLGVAKS